MNDGSAPAAQQPASQPQHSHSDHVASAASVRDNADSVSNTDASTVPSTSPPARAVNVSQLGDGQPDPAACGRVQSSDSQAANMMVDSVATHASAQQSTRAQNAAHVTDVQKADGGHAAVEAVFRSAGFTAQHQAASKSDTQKGALSACKLCRSQSSVAVRLVRNRTECSLLPPLVHVPSLDHVLACSEWRNPIELLGTRTSMCHGAPRLADRCSVALVQA